MRKQAMEFHIHALKELDALVCEHVMEECPSVHWEDSCARFQFESFEEALEALQDPVFKSFIPADQWDSMAVQEVQEFTPYSSKLNEAWKVIDRLAPEPVSIERAEEGWRVSFGRNSETEAETPAIAICLAALRSRGVVVVFEKERKFPH